MNTISTASAVWVCAGVDELIVDALPAVSDELTLPAVNDELVLPAVNEELTLPAVNVELTVVVVLAALAAFAPVRFAVFVNGWLWYALAVPSLAN